MGLSPRAGAGRHVGACIYSRNLRILQVQGLFGRRVGRCMRHALPMFCAMKARLFGSMWSVDLCMGMEWNGCIQSVCLTPPHMCGHVLLKEWCGQMACRPQKNKHALQPRRPGQRKEVAPQRRLLFCVVPAAPRLEMSVEGLTYTLQPPSTPGPLSSPGPLPAQPPPQPLPDVAAAAGGLYHGEVTVVTAVLRNTGSAAACNIQLGVSGNGLAVASSDAPLSQQPLDALRGVQANMPFPIAQS
eukprot:365066-Chlamydomonas_euryale.AAC.9